MSATEMQASINDLTPEKLMEAARQQAQLDDFGDERFVEPLTRFLESVTSEGRLSPVGIAGVAGSVTNFLVNRLRMQRDMAEHPEILDEDVSSPFVIIGLPRTGTTKLQRMMSADPGAQSLKLWRLINPAPLPGTVRGEPDPRIAVAYGFVDILSQLSPDFRGGHHVAAEEADEDVFLMEASFDSILQPIRYHVPSYEAWWRERPRIGTYREHERTLQYLQWQDGGGLGRPWILKTAAHLGALDTLFEVFPGATVIHIHRDLSVTLPSIARLNELFRAMSSDQIDRLELGEEVLSLWSREMARHLRQREDMGDRLRILDVSYQAVVDRPLEVIQEAYRLHGAELSDASLGAMREWEIADSEQKLGRQLSYSAEQFGYTPEKIEAAFAPYQQRFASLLEK